MKTHATVIQDFGRKSSCWYLPIKGLGLLFLLFLNAYMVFAQVGVQTDNPDPSSALDIVSSNKGILIPRVILTANLASPDPVEIPAIGLLIFNAGTNQAEGFYYWTGLTWTALGGDSGGDAWLTTGNSGTNVELNHMGTNDENDFAIFTNNNERIRLKKGGQVIIGDTVLQDENELFSVFANENFDYGISCRSSHTGIYSKASRYGIVSLVDDTSGYSFYGKNESALGYGGIVAGSNSAAYILVDHSAGLSSHGTDGIFTTGVDKTSGIGIIAGGNGASTLSTIPTGAGGAFTGFHGLYAKSIDDREGTGVIGVGNDGTTYIVSPDGSGGAFSGYHGVFAHATYEYNGTGVIGSGNDGGYYLMSNGMGSGGAFTGDRTGVAGWATDIDNSSIGVFGQYNGSGGWRDGIGVKGVSLSNTGRGYGVYGQGNRYGVFSNGNFGSTGAKSFVIDHPLDPANKILKHFSIESPEILNLYRGTQVLDANGESGVVLPEYFIAINTNFSYTLTPIGSPSPNLFIKQEIDDKGSFVIGGGKPKQKVSWVVYAERNDQFIKSHPETRDVEITKEPDQKGLYLQPKLFDQPDAKGIFYSPEGELISPEKRKSIESAKVKEIEDYRK